MPCLQTQAIQSALTTGDAYDQHLILPFSGTPVLDFIINVALSRGFNIKHSFYQLTPMSVDGSSPVIPVATWASSAVIVSNN